MTLGYKIVASTGIDRGDREYQQDQLALIAHPRVAGCVLGLVADGMGGRSGGRKASDQVMMTARQLFNRYHPDSDDPASFLRQLAMESHVVIQLIAVSAEQEPHSTIAGFVLNPEGECHWVHSGDSRLYHFHGDRLIHRSTDHSYVQALVDRGELTPEQARDDPRSNVLLHCLGMEREPELGAHRIDQMAPGDSLLVCSDGLWHYFTEEELGRVIDMLSPREACEFLVGKARQRAYGRGDNISLIVVKFMPLDAPG
jgi:PPM family protein phosphatase